MMLAKSVLSMPSTGRSMKNQTSREQQQALSVQLPEAVQSRQQPRLAEAELGRSKPATPANSAKCQRFSPLLDAIEFLEGQCGFLVVQIQIVPALWRVVGPDRGFGINVDYEQLLAFANSQHKALVKLALANGLDTIAKLLESGFQQPAQQNASPFWPVFDQKQIGSLTREVNT